MVEFGRLWCSVALSKFDCKEYCISLLLDNFDIWFFELSAATVLLVDLSYSAILPIRFWPEVLF